MYLQNKYTQWYYSIINRAQSRTLPGYKERHHIIPRSLGGNNTKSNLANLTAKEHYICHQLLTRMTTGKAKSKMHLALLKMCVVSSTHQENRIKLSGAKYQKIRIKAGRANSGVNSSTYGRKRTADEEARRLATWKKTKSINGLYVHTDESKFKISKANTGHSVSGETRKRWSKIRKGRPGQDNNSGKRYYNNGVKNYLGFECPAGYIPGKLQKQKTNYSNGTKWFNDGLKNYRATNCPPGCVPGILKIFSG